MGSENTCVQIAPDNVLCHHSKHLMGYFEDNLPSFEYFRKITLTTFLRKAGRGRDSSPLSLLIIRSVDKTHVLVVSVELIWLLLLNIYIFLTLFQYRTNLLGSQDSKEAM